MQAEIRYTRATGEKLVNETFGPNNIRRRTSGAEEAHRVEIADGRRAELSLDANGFVLVEHRTQGARSVYAVRVQGFASVRDFLDEFWDTALARLEEIAGP